MVSLCRHGRECILHRDVFLREQVQIHKVQRVNESGGEAIKAHGLTQPESGS